MVAHQHGERLGGLQPYEFDMLEDDVVLRRQYEARAARHAGQHAARLRQQPFQRLFVTGDRSDLTVDSRPFLGGQVTHLHEGVNKEAQPRLGRQATGADMRRIDEAKLFEIAHDVADGGG